jgi:hypothetical protein
LSPHSTKRRLLATICGDSASIRLPADFQL